MSNKPNVIVLDFNGALFPKRFVFAKPDSDPVLVNIIKVLCEQYNFRIVISSLMSEQGIYVRRKESPEYERCEEYTEFRHGEWIRFGEVEFLVSLIPYVGMK